MESKRVLKSLTEENDQLKLYIETLNKECMELQAAIFEEANKMARNAYAAEHAALKRANELDKENSMLKNEIQDLKNIVRLHHAENSKAFAVKRSLSANTPETGKDMARRLRRFSFLLGSSSTLPPPSPVSRVDQRKRSSTFNTSIINVTSHEPITRGSLFEALTTSTACFEAVSHEYFQDFIDWVDGGCSLSWLGDSVEVKQPQQVSMVNITFEDDRSSDERFRSRTNSEAGDIRLPYSASSSLPPSLLPPPPLKETFFHRIVREDVEPALDFANVRLCAVLRRALSHLGVEMEPLPHFADFSPTTEEDTLTCPLVLGEPVKYNLKIEVLNEDCSTSIECCKISSWARQRIAAVADLLQYLSLIRRGLTGTPVLNSPLDSSPSANRDSCAFTPKSDVHMEQIRHNQFENVQRRRLIITFARLGYGLPSMD